MKWCHISVGKTTCRRTPYELRLGRIKFKLVRLHPTSNARDTRNDLGLKCAAFGWLTEEVYLCVICITMIKQTMGPN